MHLFLSFLLLRLSSSVVRTCTAALKCERSFYMSFHCPCSTTWRIHSSLTRTRCRYKGIILILHKHNGYRLFKRVKREVGKGTTVYSHNSEKTIHRLSTTQKVMGESVTCRKIGVVSEQKTRNNRLHIIR